jgi:glycosyltransferase involved in cell wall biosynthesis
MEAMQIGLPCVVTKVGANQDLVKTGFNGTLVQPGDKAGLENAIIFYIKNKQLVKSFGENSKTIIEAGYSSTKKYAEKYYELWDRCAVK